MKTPNHALQRTAPRVTARAFCERSGIYFAAFRSFHRWARAAPRSAVAELGVVRRCYALPVNESHEDQSVEIRSSRGRRILRFHSLSGDYFAASIDGDGPRATKRIYGYTDCEFLVQLFEQVASDWRGWQGERTWESIEGDLRLALTSRSTGQITIFVTLLDYDEDQDWRLTIPIFTEAGQLESIARQVAAFFR